MVEKLKPLHLTLKKKWFDLIKEGKKVEEYREIKPYWTVRFIDSKSGDFKKFSCVIFKNGYADNSPTMKVEFKGIGFGMFEGERVYVVRLGERLG